MMTEWLLKILKKYILITAKLVEENPDSFFYGLALRMLLLEYVSIEELYED